MTERIWASMAVATSFATIVCSSPVGAHPSDGAATAKQTIERLISLSNAAAERKDVDGTIAYMSPTYVAIDNTGKKSTFDDAREGLSQLFSFAQSISAHTDIVAFTKGSKSATFTLKNHVVADINNQSAGKESVLAIDDIEVDTWIETAHGWREQQTRGLGSTTTLDGQPISAGGVE